MAKKKNKEFTFPQKLLEQINECSSGGYLLFVFNKDGAPEIHSQFDHIQGAMAMQYYINNWTNAIDQMNLNNTIENIHNNQEDGDSPPNEDAQ